MRLNSEVPDPTTPVPFSDIEWFAIMYAVGGVGVRAEEGSLDHNMAVIASKAIQRVAGVAYMESVRDAVAEAAKDADEEA